MKQVSARYDLRQRGLHPNSFARKYCSNIIVPSGTQSSLMRQSNNFLFPEGSISHWRVEITSAVACCKIPYPVSDISKHFREYPSLFRTADVKQLPLCMPQCHGLLTWVIRPKKILSHHRHSCTVFCERIIETVHKKP